MRPPPCRHTSPSRADETDNWAAAKKPSEGLKGGRGIEEGSSIRSHALTNRRVGFRIRALCRQSRYSPPKVEGSRERKVIGFGSSGGADSNDWNKKMGESNVGSDSVGAGGGRPRLVLQPRSLSASNEGGDGNVGKPKGVNPFGEARPREQT
ncbi:hypothetical protein V8G54_032838 [Vigna mungo]|uniref:Uncharacterized protein n=1 Tax=Vigna mungo TaxID=3915 RepID=A0AAQ3MMU0_VIGMU